MQTATLQTDPKDAMEDAVRQAVELLQGGEVVAVPTETVYGLAADAFNEDAVAKVFGAKERPRFDPLIVHILDAAHLDRVARIPEGLEKVVRRMANDLWPGPLTFLFPKDPSIPDIVTAGLPTVAVRVSQHPVMKAIIKALGKPLAAPSANRFGKLSPTSATAVQDELSGRIPLILDGGACACGLESTIISIEEGKKKPTITVHRAGPITKDDLKVYGKVLFANSPREHDEKAPPDAPGQLSSHYAPRTPLRLLRSPDEFKPEDGKRYALLSFRGLLKDGYVELTDFAKTEVLSPGSGKLPEAAVRFFYLLRQLDLLGVDEIIAEPVPDRGLGVAILERLRRASS